VQELKEVGQSPAPVSGKKIIVDGREVSASEFETLRESSQVRLDKVSEAENTSEYKTRKLMFG
jgi:hypothetical protein